MKTLLPVLVSELAEGRAIALATVVQSTGSVPRGAGACMLMTQGGAARGTVGGGILEHRAETELKAMLATAAPSPDAADVPTGTTPTELTVFACASLPSRLESYALTQNEVQSLGMVCGGHVALLYQLLTPAMLPFFEAMHAHAQGGDNLWLLRRVTGGHVTEMALLRGEAAATLPQGDLCGRLAVWHAGEGDTAMFVEPIHFSTHAYLFGGGHVSQCVAPLLQQLDFSPVVYDDRPAFANRALFPTAADVICAPFGEAGKRLRISTEDEVVIMTRGHANDLDTLVQALRTPAYYIGLIGSRSKIAHTKALALSQGFTEADFARVHTPIGLPIKAETPMEIAVSVAAEMIKCRAERAERCGPRDGAPQHVAQA